MKVAILTSPNQWFIPYAEKLTAQIEKAKLFFNHKEIDSSYEIIFILAYHNIIELKYLKRHKHNIVIHESALPQGKGWAPMFWQILEGKNKIPFTMFEASEGIDRGDIYMKATLKLTGYELNEELREKQANFSIKMCLRFLRNYNHYKSPTKQKGTESFYVKRSPNDSELDINKSIKDQFNLLRIVNNDEYPAYFVIDDHKYIITIKNSK